MVLSLRFWSRFICQDSGMSLEQAPQLKAPDAPIVFKVWYDYI